MAENIGVRISPQTHARIEVIAKQKGGITQFVRSLLETIAADPSAAPPTKTAEEEHIEDLLRQILNCGPAEVLPWLRQTLRLIQPKDTALNQEEARLIEEYRRSSFDKRWRMLSFAAKAEDLGPEAMPPPPPKKKK